MVTHVNTQENDSEVRLLALNKGNWKIIWAIFLIITISAIVRAVWLANTVPYGYVNIKGVCSNLHLNLSHDAKWIIPLEGTGFKHLMARRYKVFSHNEVNLKTDKSDRWQTIKGLETTDQIVDSSIQIMSAQPSEIYLTGVLGTIVTFNKEAIGRLEIEGVEGYMTGGGSLYVSTDTLFRFSTTSDKEPRVLNSQKFSLVARGKSSRELLKIHFDANEDIYPEIEARWNDDKKALEKMPQQAAQVSRIDITNFRPSQMLIDAKTPKGIDQLNDITVSANIVAVKSDSQPMKVWLENMNPDGIQISIEGLSESVRIDSKDLLVNRLTQILTDPFAKQNLLDWFLIIVWLGTIVLIVVKTVLEQKVQSFTRAS